MTRTIDNNPAHQAAMARRDEEKRQKNAGMLATGFWGGLVVGGVATLGLIATYFMYYTY